MPTKKQYEHILTKEFLEKEYVQNKKTVQKISKETEISRPTVKNYLKLYDILIEERNGRILPGTKFDKLTTVYVSSKNNRCDNVWCCKCECGNERLVSTYKLKSGKTKNCGCSNYVFGKESKKWVGHEEISGSYWWSIKNGAKTRNILFNITIQQIWELFEKQNKKCYLSGLEIGFKEKTKKDFSGTASLDRKDSSVGYEIENIGWVHKDINIMKFTFSVKEFIDYCKLITEFNGIFKKCSYDFITHKTYIKSLVKSAKKRNLSYELTDEQLLQKFNDQGGVCVFTGLDLIYPNSELSCRKKLWNASLDRIDNNLGYTFDNVQWTHKNINHSRNNLTAKEYKDFCKIVYLNNHITKQDKND